MSNRSRSVRPCCLVALGLTALVVLAVAPGSVGGAGHGTPHSSCTTINSSGLHVLSGDVTTSSDVHCFEIETSDVTFDGNGYTVDGVDDDGRAFHVPDDLTVSNVTIRNVTVTNWATGLYLDEAADGSVRNVTISSTSRAGINLYHSPNNSLENVTVTGGEGEGIYFTSNATGNVVKNSRVSDNDGPEVFMDSWDGDLPTNRFENLDMGDSTAPNTTLSFTGRAVVLDDVDDVAADPGGWHGAGRALNVTGITGDAYLDLTLEYAESDVSNPDARVALFERDGTAWSELAGSTHDSGATTVSANLTSLPTFSDWRDVGAFAAARPETNADGEYVVTTVDELQWIESDLDGDFVLGNDVDASAAGAWNDGAGFDPLGSDPADGTAFTGSFDGNDHKISNLHIERGTTTHVGLFGFVGATGTVENVTLEDNTVVGNEETGGIVGENEGIVSAAYVTGPVEGYGEVGGVVGLNYGTVSNSSVTGAVAGGGSKVGGLVGWNFGTVTTSFATGAVQGYDDVGGLVGENRGTLERSYATGTVSGDRFDVGGLVGYSNGDVEDAYWDEGTTNQGSDIGNHAGGSAIDLVGFGSTGDSQPAPEMTGASAADNMSELDFDGPWATTDAYPRLNGSVTGLTATFDATDLDPGETTNVTATVQLADGSAASVTTVANYTSSDPDVATVDAGGLVTAEDPGSATVTVEHAGESDSAEVTTLDHTAPTAEAGSDRSTDAGVPVTLDASGSSDDGRIASYDWEFGDGATASDVSPTHVYGSPGTYEVTLTVTDGAGHTDSDTATVTVDHAWTSLGYRPDGNRVAPDGIGVTTGPFELWNTDGIEVDSSPAVVDGTVYVGSYGGDVYAFDAETGAQEWNFSTGDFVFSSPTVVDGTVYVGSGDDSVYALDAETGAKAWEYATGGDVRSSPLVWDGLVYVGSDDGTLYAIDDETGKKEWEYTTGDRVTASPAVANGTIYVGSGDDSVYAVNATDGTERWSFPTGDNVQSAPTVVDGTVYVGSYDGNVYALNASDGMERWNVSTPETQGESPAVADGTVYVAGEDGVLYAFDADTGVEEWSYATSGSVFTSPAVVDGTVYVGTYAGRDNLHALDADTGSEHWVHDAGGFVTGSPTPVDGRLYVGADTEGVVAFGPRAVSNVTLDNPSGQTLSVTVRTRDRLGSMTVSLSGAESATLPLSAFDETVDGEGYSYTASYDAASDGNYTATVTEVTDEVGYSRATGTQATVEVSTPPDDGGGAGGGSGGSGGGGGGNSGDADVGADGEERTNATTVVVVDDGDAETDTGDEGSDALTRDVSVTVRHPQPGQTVVVGREDAWVTEEYDGSAYGTDDAGAGVESDVIRIDRLAVEIDTDGTFDLSMATYGENLTRPAGDRAEELRAPRDVQAAAASFENATGTVAAGYLEVDHTLESDEVAGATVEFSVPRATLDELGVRPSDVTLYRQVADGWEVRETTHLGSGETTEYFEGTTPGFSIFAIGTGAPAIDVTDATLDRPTVTVGQAGVVTATVENRGTTSREYTVELLANGEPVDTESVTVAADDASEVGFEFEPEATGEYDLSVDGEPAGVLTVGAADGEGTASGSDDEPGRSSTEEGGGGDLWVGAVLILLAGAIGLLYSWRRRG